MYESEEGEGVRSPFLYPAETLALTDSFCYSPGPVPFPEFGIDLIEQEYIPGRKSQASNGFDFELYISGHCRHNKKMIKLLYKS